MDRHPAYQEFVHYILENYVISKKKADQIVEECSYAAQMGKPVANIMEYLQSQLEINSRNTFQEMLGKLVHLMNNTRLWILKGYTKQELTEREKEFLKPSSAKEAEIIDFKTRKKIGRNDPCPSGSGKKFKKCCLPLSPPF
ncbi:hypothetical protein BSNK01_30820 [Bacillaceae bacterium]